MREGDFFDGLHRRAWNIPPRLKSLEEWRDEYRYSKPFGKLRDKQRTWCVIYYALGMIVGVITCVLMVTLGG